jgi:hypothetical protein
LYDGADQKRLTCVGDTGIAERFVGGSETVAALACSFTDTSMRIKENSTNSSLFTHKNRQNRLINTRIKLLADWVKSVLANFRNRTFF